MSERQISWFCRKGEQVAGIEDTGNGWAVVNGSGTRLMSADGYTEKTRRVVEDYYLLYLERVT